MKSVKFHLKLKDTGMKARLSHEVTEVLRILVGTFSQFGSLWCGSLNWLAEAKQQILLTPHVQSGGPAGNAQSIPQVLLDVNEVTD